MSYTRDKYDPHFTIDPTISKIAVALNNEINSIKDGPTGPKGDAGPQGVQGWQGQKGERGYVGVQGIQGATGSKADKGEQGPIGPEGGPTGPIGYKGQKGEKGQKGDLGPTGIQGQKGEIGVTGATGLQGVKGDKGIQGDKGQKGEIGEKGQKGDIGEKGEKGVKGDKGEIGPVGPTGNTGIQGIQGNTGLTGATGVKGEIGPQGVGATGAKGIKGQRFAIDHVVTSVANLSGVTGVLGNFAIINSNVNDPDNSKLYVYDGSQWSYQTDMSGIQGNKGDTGITGATGTTGTTGVTGATGVKGDNAFNQTLNSTDTVEFAKLTVDDIILDTKIYRNESVATTHGDSLLIAAGSTVAGTASDKKGGNLVLQGGRGKGNAPGGTIRFDTTQADSNGANAQVMNPYETVMVITGDKRIGIGTLTPSQALEVTGKVKIGAITLPNTDGTANQVLKTDGSGTLAWSTQYYDSTLADLSDVVKKGTGATQSYYFTTNQVHANATGQKNYSFGNESLQAITSGAQNIGIGSKSGSSITSGSDNISIGHLAGDKITTAIDNIFVGSQSGLNSTGSYNTVFGNEAGKLDAEGNTQKNVYVGYRAGKANTGSSNVFIGNEAGNTASFNNATNKLIIANTSTTTPLVEGDFSGQTLKLVGTVTVNTGANTVQLPTGRGTDGQILKTDGAGNTSWTNQGVLTGAGSTIDTEDLTVSRALISNASGKVAVSAITDTELGYLDGVTSAIQTQIDAKQASLTFGIADTNTVKIDHASVADNDYAKFTASGVEGRSFAEVKTDLSLNLVENTAISTWTGSANVTTVGTLTALTVNGNVIVSDGTNDFNIASHDGTNGLKLGGTLVTTSAAELNIIDGSATTQATVTLVDGDGVVISDGDVMKQCLASDFKTYVADLTLTEAAQANITSVGTLEALNVDNININGNAITSTDTNGDITITPNGTGKIVLDGLNWPQADGTANQVLKTDGSGNTSWTNPGVLTGAGSTIDTEDLAVSRALISNASGKVAVSVVTDTELSYLDGVTSAIQTQIDAKQASLTFGIADTNAVKIDHASVADNDYAKFTASGVEGRSFAEVKTDLSLNLVENTAISTWTGSANVTTVGTLTALTVNGNVIVSDGTNDFNIASHDGTNGLKLGGALVTTTAAELNILDGSATTQATVTLVDGDGVVISDGDVMKQCLASDFKTYVADLTLTEAAQANITSVGTLTTLQVDNINVNGNAITSTDTNGDITVTPDGTGKIVLDGLNWPTADGTVNQVLKTDGSGALSWSTVAAGSSAADDITVGDAAVTINTSSGAINIGTNTTVSNNVNIGTGAVARTVTVGNNTGASAVSLTSGSGGITLSGDVTLTGHIIPSTNAAYDLGNAEYKIRHLFLSDNSLWVGDQHKISIESGKMKFKKRKVSVVPKSIIDAGGTEAGALGSSGKGNLSLMTLKEWETYALTLDVAGRGVGNVRIEDIYAGDAQDYDDDFESGQVYGIADTNAVKIDHASVADNDYAKFTASGVEGRSFAEVKTDLSLNNVENTAISTWAGSANVTTVGTLTALTVNGDVTVSDGTNDFNIASHDGTNGLKLGGTLVTTTAAELNILDGSATTQATVTLADGDGVVISDGDVMKQCLASDFKTYVADLTLTEAAQANITSVGTLTALDVDNIKVDGNAITSTDTNGDITITPNGTGNIVLDGLNWPQADGTANQVLKTDGSGALSWTANSGSGSSAADDITVGDAAVTINTSSGAINIATNTTASNNVNIGTGAVARTVTIGNDTGASAVSLTSGSGGITLSGDVIISDGSNDFNIASHDGTNGLKLGGTLITTSAAELNILDGSATTQATVTLVDGDGVVISDGDVMKQCLASDFKTYVADLTLTEAAQANITSVGTLEALQVDYININGSAITSTETNGNITLTPNGSGKLVLDGISWVNADGTDGQVLKTDGSGVLSWVNQTAAPTYGIANTNAVKIDHASVADDDYAKFTANGVEGRSVAEVKTDLSLNNVENTAISTWAGSANVTTVGTLVALQVDNINVNGNAITSTDTNGNIAVTPHGSGKIVLDGISWVEADGTNGQVLKTDGSGALAWVSQTAAPTYGIANTNAVKIDHASVANDDYAKFTANGVEGRSFAEVKTDLSLNNVENTAISTWVGSANVTTVGTLTGLTVNGDVTVSDGTNDFNIASHDGTNGLKLGGTLVTTSAAELNILDGSATTQTTVTLVDGDGVVISDGDVMKQCLASDFKTYVADLTLSTAAQTNITSVGTLEALQVDNINVNGNAITSTDTNGNITVTPHGSGKIILDGISWVEADGTANQVLKTDGSGVLSWVNNSATLSGAGSTIDTEDLTVSRALISNASGKVGVSVVTDTELGYLDGVTSAIQTQIDAKQASLTFGIANTNTVKIDHASVADDDYAKFTANGLEGRSAAEMKTDLSLNLVENTAISTWTGSANVTTVGTLTALQVDNINVNGNAITSTDTNGNITVTPNGTGNIVLDGISWVEADGTDGQVLKTDGSGNLSWTANSGGSSSLNDLSDVSVASNQITFGSASTTGILPADDGGVDLGSTSYSFKDAHIQGVVYASTLNNGTSLTLPSADGTANQVLKTDGSGVLSWVDNSGGATYGIANTNAVKIDHASVANDDYAKFTASGVEGRSFAEVKTDLSLNLVENTAISTWTGSANVTTVGTLTGLTVNGDVTVSDGTNDFNIASHDGTNGLKLGGTLVTTSAAELNILDGSATTQATVTLVDGDGVVISDGDVMKQCLASDFKTYVADLTLTEAAQTNITSVGTLEALQVDYININGSAITSTETNGNITLTPNGSGKLVLDGISWVNADGTDGQVLKTDGSGVLSWVNNSATLSGAGSTIDTEDLTVSRALISNASGKVGVSVVTDTELGYLDGVTSAIQTQIDAKQASLTFGIANTNAVKIDNASVADNDYAKFTASGVEGRSFAEVKTDLSLNLVENTAISTWTGSANVTTVGTLTGLTVNGDVTVSDGTNDFNIASHDGTNGLKLGGTLVTTEAAELNILDGSATTQATVTLVDGDGVVISDGDVMKQCLASDFKTYVADLTLTEAAQANITSVGTLTTLQVDNINVNGNTITSTDTNGNIIVTPNGTGNIVLDGISWVEADGSADQVLKTDGSGNLSWTANSGSTITGAATTIDTEDLTVSRALISNASGKVAVSAVTDTELGYLDGVSSAIQTQINTKQATLTFGITNTNAVKIDHASVADDDYARFTASGLEGRSFAEMKTDLSLNLVENTAISTWAGSSNVTTVGTLAALQVDNINVNGNAITSTDTNGNITVTPHGSGNIVLDGLSWPTADGTANQVLSTNASGTLSWATVSGTTITFGIANTNGVKIDHASVADDDYAKFTANGLEGRSTVEVKTDLSLNNLDNTSDANKPVSTAQQTALDLKANLASPTFTGTVTTAAVSMGGHILPTANDTYDIGSAEYKIRDMYVSDNSLWVGDSHKIQISGGKMKFRKRKNNVVPASITTAGGTSSAALTHSGKGTLAAMTLKEWAAYGNTLNVASRGVGNVRVQDIFADNTNDYVDDFESGKVYGTSDTNAVRVDGTITSGDYAKFTANGIESKTTAEVKTELSLSNVENTAVSTWAGSGNITNIGSVNLEKLDTLTYTVTVITKTALHPHLGQGSSSGYKINGQEAAVLMFVPGKTYKFDISDSSNSGHPLKFYLDVDKSTAYTTDVTESGTAGNSSAYVQIIVNDSTPTKLFYQCGNHAKMGNYALVKGYSNITYNAPSSNNTNPSTSAQIKTALDAKQASLTYNAPSSNNANPSTSAQIKTALDTKQNAISSSVPGTATASGTAGQIAYDSSYVYICVATNTWKRASLGTW